LVNDAVLAKLDLRPNHSLNTLSQSYRNTWDHTEKGNIQLVLCNFDNDVFVSSPNNCFLSANKQIDKENISNILYNLEAYQLY